MSDETKEARLTYEEIKAQCLKEGRLYEDPDFPGFGEKSFGKETCHHVWKRPKDIVKKPDVPEFFVEGTSRFDIRQGDIGDCWLVSSIATVCEREELLEKIIPPGQDFKPGSYAGIFRFNFWSFGKWTEVIIDDRLPICPKKSDPNNLASLKSSVSNEFWSALLEKACAKLNGGYIELVSGHPRFAFEDLSGGLGEDASFKDYESESFWKVLLEAYEERTLMSSSVLKSPELDAAHNLITAHSYSLTNVKEVSLTADGKSNKRLIRLRNPWGHGEWIGSWDDKSTEWKSVPDAVKKELGLVDKEDGEFWMSYEDYFTYFYKIEMCHYRMDESTNTMRKRYWNLEQNFGSWKKDVSAGGSGKVNKDSFYSNPQFKFDVKETNADDINVIVALMQKPPEKRKTDMYSISLNVYKVDESLRNKRLDAKFFASQKPINKANSTTDRESVQQLKLAKGLYCVVPYTANYNDETDFLLRIYTVKPSKAVI